MAAEVAYLGPPGTYSHLVAEKRFPRCRKLVPLPTILDVCEYISGRAGRCAVVPIENSSGGAIYETVDILLANSPRIHVMEELCLDVKLALLGFKGERMRRLYSHFAPLEHCHKWLKKKLPNVEHRVVASTAAAAERATLERGAMALGSRRLAKLYDLEVIHYPVQADIPNLTYFLTLSGKKRPVRGKAKTTLAVRLPNKPGALCTFLEVFRNESVNLSRLISRPIRGCPGEYAFLVDLQGGADKPRVRKALGLARKRSVSLRVVGSYPCHKAYKS